MLSGDRHPEKHPQCTPHPAPPRTPWRQRPLGGGQAGPVSQLCGSRAARVSQGRICKRTEVGLDVTKGFPWVPAHIFTSKLTKHSERPVPGPQPPPSRN